MTVNRANPSGAAVRNGESCKSIACAGSGKSLLMHPAGSGLDPDRTGTAPLKLIACTHAAHAQTILDILNEAIVHSTALYDYVPRPLASMDAWFATKQALGFPVIGVVDDDGALLGFATYGVFRERPAYKYSVEHSVYVQADHRGRGIGVVLMNALIDAARERGVHVMVGGIDVGNRASIVMHERLGFVHAGTIREAGFKFGRWLDVGFWQLVLDTPAEPVDG